MQSLGNDFVIIDAVTKKITLSKKQLCLLANRHFGIGCDQILIAESPVHELKQDIDFGVRIFNADGTEAEQCGNGVRCLAKFLLRQKLTTKHVITVATLNSKSKRKPHHIVLKILANGNVQVDMGKPCFIQQAIRLLAAEPSLNHEIKLRNGKTIHYGAVSIGNPHAVIKVYDIRNVPVDEVGYELQRSSIFPNGVNVSFMEIVNPRCIRLRVFERGVGETLACGSAASAAVAMGQKWSILSNRVTVKFITGSLKVSCRGSGQPLFLEGSATHVFDGSITI